MTNADSKQAEDSEAAPPKSRKRLLAVGGSAVGLALAFLAALLAVPKKEAARSFKGPFVGPLTANKVQVNLTGSKSFLIIDLNLVYDAYEEAYFLARGQDSLANAEIKDALVALTSAKTREDFSDPVNKPILMEEIRAAIEPLLFPVHVGNASAPTDADSRSGVGPGLSAQLGSFRGEHDRHRLKVNGKDRTVQIDDGPVIAFDGDETDLEVPTAQKTVLLLDVTRVERDFLGEIQVGVMGRVRRILWNEVLIQ